MGKKISSRKKKIISRRKRKSNIKRKSKRRSNRRSKRRSKSQKKQRGGANGQEEYLWKYVRKIIENKQQITENAALKELYTMLIDKLPKEPTNKTAISDDRVVKLVELLGQGSLLEVRKTKYDDKDFESFTEKIYDELGDESGNKFPKALFEYISKVPPTKALTGGGKWGIQNSSDTVVKAVFSAIWNMLNLDQDFESDPNFLVVFILAVMTAIYVVSADRARGMSNEARDERKRSYNC